MAGTHDITLNINGRRYALTVDPRRTLADAIRDDCGLTGTHLGCEHGVCGACTIILDGELLRSCLMFAVQADGRTLRTIEGLAEGENFHPLQQAFMEHHALQCGFCTPGFLMLAVALLEQNPEAGEDEIRDALSSKSLPLHRLSEHPEGGKRGGGRHEGNVDEPSLVLLELRRAGWKDIQSRRCGVPANLPDRDRARGDGHHLAIWYIPLEECGCIALHGARTPHHPSNSAWANTQHHSRGNL